MQYLPPLSALIVGTLALPIPTTAMPTWTTTDLPLPLQPLLHKPISHPRPLLVPLPESDLPPPTAIELINPTIDLAAAHDGHDPDPGSDFNIAIDIGLASEQGKGIKLIPPIRLLSPPPTALDDHHIDLNLDLPAASDLDVVPPEAPNPAIKGPFTLADPELNAAHPPSADAPNVEAPAIIHHGLPLAPMPPAAPASASLSSSPLPSMPTPDSSPSTPSPPPTSAPSSSDCLHFTLSTLRTLRANAASASTYLIPASALQWCVFAVSFWLTLCVVLGRCVVRSRDRRLRWRRGWALRQGGGRRRGAGCLGGFGGLGAGRSAGGGYGGFGGEGGVWRCEAPDGFVSVGVGGGGGSVGDGNGGVGIGVGAGTARKVLRAGQGVWVEVGDGSGRMERVCLGGDVVVGDGDGGGVGFGSGAVGEEKEGRFV